MLMPHHQARNRAILVSTEHRLAFNRQLKRWGALSRLTARSPLPRIYFPTICDIVVDI